MHAPDFLGIFLAATHGAGRDVVMAAQVLGGAMDDDVYAQGMRLLIQGRGKSVVGDGDDAFGPGQLGNRLQVGQRQGGIDRSFQHRSEEHTSELQSLMRISYAVFFLKKKKNVSIQ